MAANNVVVFPAPRRRRPVKAALRATAPPTDEREIIFLAPFLKAHRPEKVPDIVRYLRNLLPTAPPFEHAPPEHTSAIVVQAHEILTPSATPTRAARRQHQAYLLTNAHRHIAEGQDRAAEGHRRAVAARLTMARHQSALAYAVALSTPWRDPEPKS